MQVEQRDIERAAATLRSGGLIALPTETVYGVGADAHNPAAVRRIFEVKGRPSTHPLIVHLGNTGRLDQWAIEIPALAWNLAERFWPGPMTLVLRRNPNVPLVVTGGLETVGLRVPAHPVALELLREFGGGIAAPSANRFGSVSPTTAEHVRHDLGASVDFVLDGGSCDVGIESTIIDLSNGTPEILRPGGLAREAIEHLLGVAVPVRMDGPVRASGQFPSHYAPRVEVVLVRPDELVERIRLLRDRGLRVGLIATEHVESPLVPAAVVSGTEAEIGRQLYAALRDFDDRGFAVVLAVLPPETGLGLAVADRLRRAAAPRIHRNSEHQGARTQ